MNNEERTLTIKGEGMARGQKVEVKEIPMNKIKMGRNSRLSTSSEDLSGLMQSINSTGLLEPIGVVKSKKNDGSYEITYGNRRFMAFSKLGLHSIPAVIHEYKNESAIDVMNLAENVQRRNISLAEIGRYAKILEGEGLGIKELAVRLGTSVSYVSACIDAFEEVPKAYREDLQVQVSGTKPEPGKISIHTARAIVNATKSNGITKRQSEIIFEAAKTDKRFSVENVFKYAAAIKEGRKDPIGQVKEVKKVTLNMVMSMSQYDSLIKKYVDDGPFNSFTALCKAVLRGQKQVVINFIE